MFLKHFSIGKRIINLSGTIGVIIDESSSFHLTYYNILWATQPIKTEWISNKQIYDFEIFSSSSGQ